MQATRLYVLVHSFWFLTFDDDTYNLAIMSTWIFLLKFIMFRMRSVRSHTRMFKQKGKRSPYYSRRAIHVQLGHDEICGQRKLLKTIRHEYIKKAICFSLRLVKDTNIEAEPRLRGTAGNPLRTDLKITGPVLSCSIKVITMSPWFLCLHRHVRQREKSS